MTDAPKKDEAPKAKKLTDSEKISEIVKLLKANGLSIPKELE